MWCILSILIWMMILPQQCIAAAWLSNRRSISSHQHSSCGGVGGVGGGKPFIMNGPYHHHHYVLSSDFLENDIVAVQKKRRVAVVVPTTKDAENDNDNTATTTTNNNNDMPSSTSQKSLSLSLSPRLCVVRPDNTVAPLCRHEDNVETDLFIDLRQQQEEEEEEKNTTNNFWMDITDDCIVGTYGEGWYGQRPVPSLGGGPGYGAEADEIWSIDETTLQQIEQDGILLPILDIGIAHGEKARGGMY